MAKEIRLADLVVGCPDAEKLCSFYQVLLGWKRTELSGCPAVVSENGLRFLFAQDEDYIPPVLPQKESAQNFQAPARFNFMVPDVVSAAARAEALGAVRTEPDYIDGSTAAMIDPAGHPFCLYRES